MENALVPITVETVLWFFCGSNDRDLRRHGDDGYANPEMTITGKERIFQSLVAFRIDSGD